LASIRIPAVPQPSSFTTTIFITNHQLPITNQESQIREIVAAQRKFFRTGETLPISWRIKQLKRLKAAVIAHQDELVGALCEDL
jgi:acyl-CoA reductase-like NAD-dependent aldehyde dehydrogenase